MAGRGRGRGMRLPNMLLCVSIVPDIQSQSMASAGWMSLPCGMSCARTLSPSHSSPHPTHTYRNEPPSLDDGRGRRSRCRSRRRRGRGRRPGRAPRRPGRLARGDSSTRRSGGVWRVWRLCRPAPSRGIRSSSEAASSASRARPQRLRGAAPAALRSGCCGPATASVRTAASTTPSGIEEDTESRSPRASGRHTAKTTYSGAQKLPMAEPRRSWERVELRCGGRCGLGAAPDSHHGGSTAWRERTPRQPPRPWQQRGWSCARSWGRGGGQRGRQPIWARQPSRGSGTDHSPCSQVGVCIV